MPSSVAVVACHWVGDTLWAAQVLPALAERFGRTPIVAITRPACRDLFHGVLPATAVLSAPAVVSDRRREPVSWAALAAQAAGLADRRFGLIIDLTGNRYSAALTFLARPDCSLGFDGGELGWLYSHRVGDAERADEHLSRRPFRVIEPLLPAELFARHVARPIRPPVPTVDPAETALRLGLDGRPLGVIAPGAGWRAKEWPLEHFIDVGRRLAARGWQCVVTGSGTQRALCREVARGIGQAPLLVGRPLGNVVAVLSLAAGVLANDSGIAHLAAALGRPTAAVFTGATDPRKCGPIGSADRVRVFMTPVRPEQVAEFLLSCPSSAPQIRNSKSEIRNKPK